MSSGVVALRCTQFVPTCPATSAPLFAMHSTNSSSRWKLSARCARSWAYPGTCSIRPWTPTPFGAMRRKSVGAASKSCGGAVKPTWCGNSLFAGSAHRAGFLYTAMRCRSGAVRVIGISAFGSPDMPLPGLYTRTRLATPGIHLCSASCRAGATRRYPPCGRPEAVGTARRLEERHARAVTHLEEGIEDAPRGTDPHASDEQQEPAAVPHGDLSQPLAVRAGDPVRSGRGSAARRPPGEPGRQRGPVGPEQRRKVVRWRLRRRGGRGERARGRRPCLRPRPAGSRPQVRSRGTEGKGSRAPVRIV